MAKKSEPGGATTAGIITAVFAWLLVVLLPPDQLTAHLSLPLRVFLGVLLILAAYFGFRYYLILAGADERHGSEERVEYDTLRQSLKEGGTPAIVYNLWLTVALEKVDEFFGDAGRKDKSSIARALRLETDGPRWTAPAFDKCLLLALLYPVVTVFTVWAISGHVGPAEHALQLPPDNPADQHPALRRALTFGLAFLISYSSYRYVRTEGLKRYLWLAVAGAVVVVVVVVVVVSLTSEWAKRKGHFGLFLSLFFAAASIACLAAPYGLAPQKTWPVAGALLLFFGLLTLVNAPVDWLAIGFTRALLRRGLSRGGWSPYLFALLDVLVAAILVSVLAFAMVLAIQTFDDIAVYRAGRAARILPLGPLFEGLESTPGDYQYWWVWLLLFSSMIPSIFNLLFAGAAFLRGLPRFNTWILNRMPVGQAVRERDKLKVAAALTGQLVGGVALTGMATYLVAVYLIPLVLPAFGAIVRDFAEGLAAYNAPAHAMKWLAGVR